VFVVDSNTFYGEAGASLSLSELDRWYGTHVERDQQGGESQGFQADISCTQDERLINILDVRPLDTLECLGDLHDVKQLGSSFCFDLAHQVLLHSAVQVLKVPCVSDAASPTVC
jgi:hypothetical protein